MATVLEIQRRLSSLGYQPGPLDGIRGPKTIAAIKQFQRARGLVADGIVGPYKLAQVCDERGVVAVSGPGGAVFCATHELAEKLCELANAGLLPNE